MEPTISFKLMDNEPDQSPNPAKTWVLLKVLCDLRAVIPYISNLILYMSDRSRDIGFQPERRSRYSHLDFLDSRVLIYPNTCIAPYVTPPV